MSVNSTKLDGIFLLLVLCASITYCLKEKDKPTGHLKKLGSHRDPLGVTMIGKFSSPAVFYEHFVKPGKPLWMRSVLKFENHPGLTNWTDAFLKKQFGNVVVGFENSKKENRKSSPNWLSFGQFLSLYKTEDIYMVQSLKDRMEELVLIPATLQCGGFQRAIQDAVMWLGSGSAMSVLHSDDLDNLLCLMDGRKDFVLIDKAYKHEVESDGFVESGAYSLVNVAKVDLVKFPLLANVPWHQVHLDKGDCIFIPRGWYHQVTSSKNRHLAVNLWFSHLYWFSSTNCSNDQNFHMPLEPISTFGFATPNEVYRCKLLEKLHDKGILFKDVFISSLDTSTEERRNQFFEAIDKYQDNVLSWSELYGFNIDKAIVKFPDIFGLPGSSLSVHGEKIILYDPIPKEDDNLKDDIPKGDSLNDITLNDDINDKDTEMEQEALGGVISDGSHSTDSDVDVASLPLPDDPVVVDVSHKESEWNHHNLYHQTDVEDIHDVHEHTGHSHYHYSESEADDMNTHQKPLDQRDEL